MVRSLVIALLATTALLTAPTRGTPPPLVDAAAELALLAGEWEVVSETREGDKATYPPGERIVVRFGANGNWTSPDEGCRMRRIDPAKAPKEIDWRTSQGDCLWVLKLIYALDGDTFVTCETSSCSPERPTKFESTARNGWLLREYKRVRK